MAWVGESPEVWVLILHWFPARGTLAATGFSPDRVGQSWHLGATPAGFLAHQPDLAVALPGLDRVGLADRAFGHPVPAELDLHAGFAVATWNDVHDLVVG